MEPQAALVGPDGAVHLHAKTAIDLHLAVVVHPRNTEQDDSFGLDQPLEDLGLAVGRIGLDHGHHRLDHFVDGLVKLGLAGVLGDDLLHEIANFIVNRRRLTLRNVEIDAVHGFHLGGPP